MRRDENGKFIPTETDEERLCREQIEIEADLERQRTHYHPLGVDVSDCLACDKPARP